MRICARKILAGGLLVGALSGGVKEAWAQSKPGPCPAEPASLKPTEPDIFSDQQEQWLGDAEAEFIERDMRFAPAAENVYLQAMGERMLATLPPTGIHFQFRVYESGELDAFGISGGRIYVSRKLIAALQNEDELAGILAHEIGHIVAHQGAIEVTAMLRDWLGVNHVGDRADVFAQVHALDQANPKKAHWHPPSEEHDQDVADEVAVYAMIRAGYQPRAYAEAFDRITANQGKTGNGLADFLGLTTESSRRYRADVKMATLVPNQCLGKVQRDPAAFSAWQKLLAERTEKHEDTLAATRVLTLAEPLRSDLRSMRYSPDGKFLVTQDYSKIFVVQRRPLKLLFSIDAEDSLMPHFTPDSKEIVFVTSDLRVERWDVASQKRTLVKEMILPRGCDQQVLSPDGKVMACEVIYIERDGWPKLDLELWNVQGNDIIFSRPHFTTTSPTQWRVADYLMEMKYLGIDPGEMRFSPDSTWFVAGMLGEQVIYDVRDNRKALGEKGLEYLRGLSFAFAGNNKIVMATRTAGQVVSFPDGKVLLNFPMGTQQIDGVTQGDYVLMHPFKGYAMAVVDLATAKPIAASHYKALDIYVDEMATETPRGGVQVNSLKTDAPVESMDLPQSLLGGLTDGRFTPDGRFLLVSTPQRSAIWNLENGNRMVVLRPYSRAAVLPGDMVYFDFAKQGEDDPRMQGTVNLVTGAQSKAGLQLPEKAELVGDMYLLPKPDDDHKPQKNTTYEFHDLTTGALAWSRRFDHAIPSIYRDASRDRIGMWWEMSDGAGREQIDSEPALKQAMEAMGNARDGMVLQMVDAKTGKVLDTIAVKEHKPKQARDVRELLAFGDYLLVEGENKNTAIYRLSDKARIGEVYGRAIAGDAASGMLAMTNRRNEVFLLDAATAKEMARYTLSADVRMAVFPAGQMQLLVLTAEQKVYTFSMETKGEAATGAASAKP